MGVRDILRDIPVECPYCQKENVTNLESIDLRDQIQCLKCGKSFVIGDVFELLYAEEPLAESQLMLSSDMLHTNGHLKKAVTRDVLKSKNSFDELNLRTC